MNLTHRSQVSASAHSHKLRSSQTGRQQSAFLPFDVLAIPLGHPALVAIHHTGLQFVLELGELELAELREGDTIIADAVDGKIVFVM